jgi:hypothetical protein
MALMANTSFAAEGRDEVALAEHDQIVARSRRGDGEAAYQALRTHISRAFETRLAGGGGRIADALRLRPDRRAALLPARCQRLASSAWSKMPWVVLSQ